MPPRPPGRRGQGELRGGHRQQAFLEADSAPGTRDIHSPLARFLLRSFFLGEMSLPIALTIAMLALSEKPEGRWDLEKLASLGCDGARPNHFLRDLVIRMVRFPIEAAVALLDVPVWLAGRRRRAG